MGEAIGKLVALAGLEHVSGYTRKSSTGNVVHVGAYTRSPGSMSNHALAAEALATMHKRDTYQPVSMAEKNRFNQVMAEVNKRRAAGEFPQSLHAAANDRTPGIMNPSTAPSADARTQMESKTVSQLRVMANDPNFRPADRQHAKDELGRRGESASFPQTSPDSPFDKGTSRVVGGGIVGTPPKPLDQQIAEADLPRLSEMRAVVQKNHDNAAPSSQKYIQHTLDKLDAAIAAKQPGTPEKARVQAAIQSMRDRSSRLYQMDDMAPLIDKVETAYNKGDNAALDKALSDLRHANSGNHYDMPMLGAADVVADRGRKISSNEYLDRLGADAYPESKNVEGFLDALPQDTTSAALDALDTLQRHTPYEQRFNTERVALRTVLGNRYDEHAFDQIGRDILTELKRRQAERQRSRR